MQAELGRRRRRAARFAAVSALVATAAVAAAVTSAADDGPGAGGALCGLLPPADPLLRCKAPAPPTERTSTQPASQEQKPLDRTPRPVFTVPTVARYVADQLLIRFWPGTTPARQADVIDQAGATVERRLGSLGVVVARMAPARRDAALRQLRASRWVVSAERNALVGQLDITPNDSFWADQWGLRRIGLPTAWDRTRGSSSVVVAVLDTGVDAGHPDLTDAVLAGFNIVADNADTHDEQGHGTAAAGIIAARTNNRQGVAGICWVCSILPVKVIGADGTGTMDDLALGIVRAVDSGARVISMSIGGPAGSATLDQAIAYATAKNAVLVAAAGNSGSSAPFYPAANPDVISVAGTDESDRLYSWSNYGDWARVTAPGCNPAPALSGGYVIFCGTSSATPVVSGLIALELSLVPGASVPAVVQAITETTRPANAAVARGRIDAPASLSALARNAGLTDRVSLRPASWSLRGSLTRQRPTRLYQHLAGPGPTTIRLTSTRRASVSLAIIDPTGRTVGRLSGTTPLVLSRRLGRGTYAFALRGTARSKVAFKLTVGPRDGSWAGVSGE